MNVEFNELTPAGYAVKLDLANGWTVSLRQGWGDTVSVMAWPTGTNTAVPSHRFAGQCEQVTDLTDAEAFALVVEVAALPLPTI